MPNIKANKKSVRQTKVRTARNRIRRDAIRSARKRVNEAVAKGDLDQAKKELSLFFKAADKAAKRNVIHKNKASRIKSRLDAKIKKAAQPKATA